jgi:hypothetical protein
MRSLTMSLFLSQCFLVACGASGGTGAASSSIAANPTDLPTYPHLSKASVMHTGRATAKIYNAETPDAYDTVIAWYRQRLIGAKETESGYEKDLLTFSLPNGKQVIVQGRPPITYITLSNNAD